MNRAARSKPLQLATEVPLADWLDIETAPRDGTVIRLRFRDPFGFYDGHGRDSWVDGRWVDNTAHGQVVIMMQPTHWQPLPDPP